MGIIDIIVMIIFLFGLYIGYQKGVIKQISDLIILFISSFLAGRISDILFGILYNFLPFFNFNGKSEGLKSINIILWKLILYLLIIILLIFSIKKILFKLKLTDKIMDSIVEANLLSKILGVIISIPLMIILIFNVSLLMLSPNFNMTKVNNSKLVSLILKKTPVLSKENNNLHNNQKYIIKRINKKDNTLENYEQVNNDIIDNIINTNLVSKEKIEKLKEKDKLLGTRKKEEVKENLENKNDDVNDNNDEQNNSNMNKDGDYSNSAGEDDSKDYQEEQETLEESDMIIEEETNDDESEDIIEEEVEESDYCEDFPADC